MAEQKMYRVYSIVPRPKQKDFWLNIGTAFPHANGEGFNVLLQSLPLPWDGQCKIVIRPYDPSKKGQNAEDTES